MEDDPDIERGREARHRERMEQVERLAADDGARRQLAPADPEKQRYFDAASTSFGAFGSIPRMGYLLMLAVVGTLVVVAGLDVMSRGASPSGVGLPQNPVLYYAIATAPLALCYTIIAAVLVIIGRISAARAGARELSWLKGLPFPVDGFLDAFGHDSWHDELKVTLSFRDQTTPQAELSGLLQSFAPGVLIHASGSELEFRVKHTGRVGFFGNQFTTHYGGSKLPGREYTANRALLLLFHDVVADVLLPLNSAHAIAGVVIDS